MCVGEGFGTRLCGALLVGSGFEVCVGSGLATPSPGPGFGVVSHRAVGMRRRRADGRVGEPLDRGGQRVRVGGGRGTSDADGRTEGQRGQFSGEQGGQHGWPRDGSAGWDAELRTPEGGQDGRLAGQLRRSRGPDSGSQDLGDWLPVRCHSGRDRAGSQQRLELLQIGRFAGATTEGSVHLAHKNAE